MFIPIDQQRRRSNHTVRVVPRWQPALEWQAGMTQGRMSIGRYVRNGIIVQQTSRASHRVLRVGRGLRSRLIDEHDDAVGGLQPASAGKLTTLRAGGALVRREPDTMLAGRDDGQPRAMKRIAAWHARSACCSRAQSTCERGAAEPPNFNSVAALKSRLL